MDYSLSSHDGDANYRYRLDVITGASSNRTAAIIQFNPSKANAQRSDATVGKVAHWAQDPSHQFVRLTFLNLFARIATNPADLLDLEYEELVGDRNDNVIISALTNTDDVIVAWGRVPSELTKHYNRRRRTLAQFVGDRVTYAVGAPVAGRFPRHGRSWNTVNRVLRPFDWETPNEAL